MQGATTQHSRGFSLIELLVAVVVLAIGLLGLAALQAGGMRFGHSAYLRSQATVLAYDISDRMRANIAAVLDGNYDLASATEHSACTNTTGCSTANMAENDTFEWRAALGARLPGGEGVVCLDSDLSDDNATDTTLLDPQCDGNGEIYVIKIWWTGRPDAQGDVDKQLFMTEFQP